VDAFVSASVAATAGISKSTRLHWSSLSSPASYPVGESPFKRKSPRGAQEDRETTGDLAEALIELGYSVEYAGEGDAKLRTLLANRPNVILCVCSTARMSDLPLLERFSEANSQRRMLPLVLLIGQRNGECAGDRIGSGDSSGGRAPLTVRERDVLTWVARGKTSAEIAIILGLSERTINFHCDSAMKRLDVINRTQAVATAIVEGLIGI